jgi:hypothetical protein
MTTDALAGELTELYIGWALSKDRHVEPPPRWQKVARELKRRHNNAGSGGCTCEDCVADWPISMFGQEL